MSLQSLFQTSRRSLRALEASIQTAGHNIANASTPGYSRQRVELQSESISGWGPGMATTPGTFTGTGVTISGYERLRDGLLDRAANDAHTALGAAEQEARTGSALEGIFATGTTGSLDERVTAFWSAWSDAADAPTDSSLRNIILDRADALTGTFQRHDADLDRLSDETRAELSGGVDAFNGIADRIADLNARIVSSRSAGAPDLSAEDERDQLVRELSAYAPVQTDVEDDGMFTLSTQGMAVVQGTEALHIKAYGPPDEATDAVRFEGTDVAFRAGEEGNGRLGGWLRTLNDHIPETRAGLDALAADIVAGVNAAHSAGYGLDNGTGRTIFDPTGVTAATIGRSTDVASPDQLALSGAPDAPGDASVALAVADLREGVERDAAAIPARAGQRLQGALSRADAADALVSHFEGLADGVSGVSIDEEMTHLIEYQQAYAASARVLTTAQSLFDTLLAI